MLKFISSNITPNMICGSISKIKIKSLLLAKKAKATEWEREKEKLTKKNSYPHLPKVILNFNSEILRQKLLKMIGEL